MANLRLLPAVLAAILLLISVPAAARMIVGVEVCSTNSCNGWGADVNEDNDVNYSPWTGQTSSNCNRNVVNVGFAIAGQNNMCAQNAEYTCKSCSVNGEAVPPPPEADPGEPPSVGTPEYCLLPAMRAPAPTFAIMEICDA